MTGNQDNADDENDVMMMMMFDYSYGSVSAGREKWPFNVLFFLKVEPPCDQT